MLSTSELARYDCKLSFVVFVILKKFFMSEDRERYSGEPLRREQQFTFLFDFRSLDE